MRVAAVAWSAFGAGAKVKAISVRQPWAWLILNAGKDIENRDWSTNVRGRILIHAARGMTHAEYDAAFSVAIDAAVSKGARCGNVGPVAKLPPFEALERGGIIGSVEIVDCVRASDSPWFFGRYGFVLRDPMRLPFRPLRGALGFFDVDGVEVRECRSTHYVGR